MKKPIAFYPQLSIELGDIPSAIYYQQLYYWSDKGKRNDGWFYKTVKEMEDETTLSRYQQDKARKTLLRRGFIEAKKMMANGSPTYHYRCLVMMDFMISKGKFRTAKTSSSKCKKLTVPTAKIRNSITENTTENTTEKGKSKDLPLYQEVSSQKYKTKKDIYKQKGIDWKPSKKTKKQETTLLAMKLIDHYREKASEYHGLTYLNHPSDLNAKIRNLVISFYKRCDEDVGKAKKVVDYYLDSYGAWCSYTPDNCFTNKTIMAYENRDKVSQVINYDEEL